MEQKIDQLMLALMAAHAEFGVTIGKDKRGNRATYASLPMVLESIHEMCSKHGLILTQESTIIEGGVPALVTLLVHPKSGQYRRSTSILTYKHDSQNLDQAWGGSSTYHRRYDAMMIMGLFCSDDPADHDGQREEKPQQKKQEPTSQTNQPSNHVEIISDKQCAFLVAKIGDKREITNTILQKLAIPTIGFIPKKEFNRVLEFVETQLGK